MKSPLRLILCVAVAGMVASAGVHAAQINVPTPANPTIASALTDSAPGDLILVAPGVYKEKLNVFKQVQIRGDCGNPAAVILDAGPRFPGLPHGIGIRIRPAADGTIVECLTVRHGTTGIYVGADECAISNCRFLHQTDDLTSVNCAVQPVNCNAAGDGVHVEADIFSIRISHFSHHPADSLQITGDFGVVDENTFDHCGANTAGDCIAVTGSMWEITENVMHYGGGDGIQVIGNNNFMRFNDAQHMDDDGFDIIGDMNEAELNTVGQTDDEGVEVNGNSNIISGNVVSGISGDESFDIEGDGNELTGNSAENADEECYLIRGSNVTLTNNSAKDCDEEGFDVMGDQLTLIGNTVEDPNEDGFNIDCLGPDNGLVDPCTELIVQDNQVITGPPKLDRESFDIFAETGAANPAVVIDGNTSLGSAQDGFRLLMNDATITNNTSWNAYDGFFISGNGNFIAINDARNNTDDGLVVSGNSNNILGNTSRDNLEDGVDAGDGSGNIIDSNSAERNGAEGIQNDGTLSIVRNNFSVLNRKDCARGAGANAIVNSNNFCADGSNINQQQQID